jgi:hypothetical protein
MFFRSKNVAWNVRVGRGRTSPLPIHTIGFRNLWPVQPLRKVNLGREKPTGGGEVCNRGATKKRKNRLAKVRRGLQSLRKLTPRGARVEPAADGGLSLRELPAAPNQ